MQKETWAWTCFLPVLLFFCSIFVFSIPSSLVASSCFKFHQSQVQGAKSRRRILRIPRSGSANDLGIYTATSYSAFLHFWNWMGLDIEWTTYGECTVLSLKRIIWIHDSCLTERMTKAWHSTPNKATLSTFYFHPHQEAFGTASTFCLKNIFKYPGAQRKGQFQKLYLGGLKIKCVCAHCILNCMSVLTVYLFLYHTCTSASKTLLDKAWNSKVTPLEGVSWRSIPSSCVPLPVATPTLRTSLLA